MTPQPPAWQPPEHLWRAPTVPPGPEMASNPAKTALPPEPIPKTRPIPSELHPRFAEPVQRPTAPRRPTFRADRSRSLFRSLHQVKHATKSPLLSLRNFDIWNLHNPTGSQLASELPHRHLPL